MTGDATVDGRPTVVRFLWDQCHLIEGRRAFVVEVPAEVLATSAFADDPHCRDADLATYLDTVASQSQRWPGTVVSGYVTCVVSDQGELVRAFMNPFFPYSGQWNGYCPLRRVGVLVESIADVAHVPEHVVEQTRADDVPSLWCLARDAWDGTDLGASGILDYERPIRWAEGGFHADQ